jgi:penicillin-binding protein 1A
VGLIALIIIGLALFLPSRRALEPLPRPVLELVTADGRRLAERGSYKEAPVVVSELPPYVPAAFVSIEDRRFYHHFGVDPQGVVRALVIDLRSRRVREGGSTITQQLAKTTFLSSNRTLGRKLEEVLIAFALELRFRKDEILSRYLSSIYFGDGVYGLRAASLHYFDTSPDRLTLGEAAVLAGMVKAPSALNPIDHPAAAAKRADLVLRAMVSTGAVSAAQARGAADVRVSARPLAPQGGYFADWAAPQIWRALDPTYGRVRVRTTLDSRLQALAEGALHQTLDRRASGRRIGEAALVAMRPDGAVVAMVGGRDYRTSQFNRATQARRQPGSAFKLFVYLAAARRGLRPDTIVSETPVTLHNWTPRNFDGESGRVLTARQAFADSSNIAAVRLFQSAGRGAVVKAARDLGVESPLAADPTLALGSSDMTLLELTSAYAAIASGRTPIHPFAAAQAEAAAPAHALGDPERRTLLDLLQSVVESGTGRAARLDQPVYGKTGTAQDHRDAVFIGFTGDLIVGVWTGNDDHSPMNGVTGGGVPAEIWRGFVGRALQEGLVQRTRWPAPQHHSFNVEAWIGGVVHGLVRGVVRDLFP